MTRQKRCMTRLNFLEAIIHILNLRTLFNVSLYYKQVHIFRVRIHTVYLCLGPFESHFKLNYELKQTRLFQSVLTSLLDHRIQSIPTSFAG